MNTRDAVHDVPSASRPTPIIEARELTRHFGGKRELFTTTPTIYAVNGVSLKVQAGETFAIVGESGSGKSTLGRLLLRLLDSTNGRVLYQGKDITSLAAEPMRRLRREMQLIFQDPFASLNPGMTVGRIVGEPIALHGLARNGGERAERVAELLRTVGLQPDYAQRYPHEFSGGQRQRISVARALAGEPKLVVGDEPVSALDVSVQAQVINLLETLKHSLGLTLIIIAHDLAVVRHMSDRVAVMYLGEIVEVARVDDLYDTPMHPYTQALLSAVPASTPHARRAVPVLGGEMPSPTEPPGGCHFHPRCPHARPRCQVEKPVNERVGDGHVVACHFWREIQNAGGSPSLASHVSAKLEERLAWYRAAQARAVVPGVSDHHG
ncbi:MAG TPA: oligopeptide/dipeptide ABC transporter ATP-binding protein [Paraburkholderia sp.]|jgi:oligopeptide/dipeptide ABC transporter ATP-binding protein|nr:oligopeptide/dipeptide ABC transporter ATP-binding protein [Paraburkholderia sp.]